MNALELWHYIERMGGLNSALAYNLQPSAIDDPKMRSAWRYLRKQYQLFDDERAGFEVILEGALTALADSSV